MFLRQSLLSIKSAVTDMRYFAWSKLSRSLVHKKNFSLIWQVVFKLGYIFYPEGRISYLSWNELGKKSRATIIFGKFCKQAIIKLSLAYSLFTWHIFSWTFDLFLSKEILYGKTIMKYHSRACFWYWYWKSWCKIKTSYE